MFKIQHLKMDIVPGEEGNHNRALCADTIEELNAEQDVIKELKSIHSDTSNDIDLINAAISIKKLQALRCKHTINRFSFIQKLRGLHSIEKAQLKNHQREIQKLKALKSKLNGKSYSEVVDQLESSVEFWDRQTKHADFRSDYNDAMRKHNHCANEKKVIIENFKLANQIIHKYVNSI